MKEFETDFRKGRQEKTSKDEKKTKVLSGEFGIINQRNTLHTQNVLNVIKKQRFARPTKKKRKQYNINATNVRHVRLH